MPVGQLCGIALGLAGDGLYSQLVNLAVGAGGEHHSVSQAGKKGVPEGIIFVHVQHPGNAHRAPGGLIRFQGRVGEEPLQLVIKQIGHISGVFLASYAPFAPVAGDKLPSAGKFVHCQTAAVGTAPALGHAGLIPEGAELFIGEHGGLLAFLPAVPGDEGGAESPHNAGNIRTHGLASGDFLKAAQDGVVVESTSLDHNISAQLRGVGDLDHLEQGVLDDRVGQPSGDVGHSSPFFLGLFYPGVHKHSTAGAQVDGMGGKDGLPGKILHIVVQGLGESLNEGTAPGGAGFI